MIRQMIEQNLTEGRKEGTLFKCLIIQHWRTNWGHCKFKLTNERKSNQMLVFEERGNRSTRRNPLGAELRTNKLNPHMTLDLGIEPGAHWWEASALTTAPSLHPKWQGLKKVKERMWSSNKKKFNLLQKTQLKTTTAFYYHRKA